MQLKCSSILHGVIWPSSSGTKIIKFALRRLYLGFLSSLELEITFNAQQSLSTCLGYGLAMAQGFSNFTKTWGQ